jgi:ABC-2 type transport system ATP-binding protein
MSHASDLIEVRNLTKSFGPVRALDDVSFSVREGEVLGFLGPNGAGKTTTLRILAGFLPGDSGTVRVAGRDVRSESLAVRRAIGYLPEGVPLYPEMRVIEYLRFRSRIKGIARSERRRAIDRALEASDITDVRRRVIGTLSRGYRQRVGLADALLGEPRVLILDEPTVGLDPEQVRHFRELLRRVGQARTVVLSTHILSEVDLVCSSVLIIHRGRIVARDRPEGLRRRYGALSSVVVEVRGPPAAVAAALERVGGVSKVEKLALEASSGGGAEPWQRLRLHCGADSDLREDVFLAVCRGGFGLRHLEREVRPLEEVFLDAVGRAS